MARYLPLHKLDEFKDVNPFVRKFTSHTKSITDDKDWTVDKYKQALDTAMRATEALQDYCGHYTKAYRAGTVHKNWDALAGANPQGERKSIAAVDMFRFGNVSKDLIDLATRISPGMTPEAKLNNQLTIEKACHNATSYTCGYFEQVCRILVAITDGGLKAIKAATPMQRRVYWMAMFKEYGLYFSRLAFRFEKNAVDFEIIFCNNGQIVGMDIWEEIVLHKVASAMETVMMGRFVNKDSRQKVMSLHKRHMQGGFISRCVTEGSIAEDGSDVPVRPMRGVGDRRLPKPSARKVELNVPELEFNSQRYAELSDDEDQDEVDEQV